MASLVESGGDFARQGGAKTLRRRMGVNDQRAQAASAAGGAPRAVTFGAGVTNSVAVLHKSDEDAISRASRPEPQRRGMSLNTTEAARRRVLDRLGLAQLVSADYLDISDGHRAHAQLQRQPATFVIDGMVIEAPAGVYHPMPESSSMLFIRNIQALFAK